MNGTPIPRAPLAAAADLSRDGDKIEREAPRENRARCDSTRCENLAAPNLAALRELYLARLGEPLAERWHTIDSATPEPPASYYRQFDGWPVEIGFWIGRVRLAGPTIGGATEYLTLHIIPQRTASGVVQQPDIEEKYTLERGPDCWATGVVTRCKNLLEVKRADWFAIVNNLPTPDPEFLYLERRPTGYVLLPCAGDVLAFHEARRQRAATSWRVVYRVEADCIRVAIVERFAEAQRLHLLIRGA